MSAHTRTGLHPSIIAGWDAGDALVSLEKSSCVEAADIALGYLLDACERLRRYDDGLAAIYERKAGDVFMGKLWTQGVAQRAVAR